MTVLSLDITQDLNALITKAADACDEKKSVWVRRTLRDAARRTISNKSKESEKED